jgi:hypothetical protein
MFQNKTTVGKNKTYGENLRLSDKQKLLTRQWSRHTGCVQCSKFT